MSFLSFNPAVREHSAGRSIGLLRGDVLILLVLCCWLSLSAQDDGGGVKANAPDKPDVEKVVKDKGPLKSNLPVSLIVSRRTLTNFLTDRVALAPYLTSDKASRPFRAAFVIDSPQSNFAVIWHQESCRVVGVVDLKPLPAGSENAAEEEMGEENDDKKNNPKSNKGEGDDKEKPSPPYVLMASGRPPLVAAMGDGVLPAYFGFRMIGDRPEFLYSVGNLAVEESIWLDDGGKKMKQRFRIGNRDESDLTLSFPEHWKDRIETATGKWKGGVLTIPEEDAGEFVLTYRLAEKDPPKDSTDKDK